MRRQGGNYGADSGGGGHQGYGGAGGSMHQHPQQQHHERSGYSQGRQREQLPIGDKEGHHHHNQWRWERDGALAKLPQTPMSPTAPFAEGQGNEAPRSYYQNQRIDPLTSLEKQGGGDPRSQSHEEDMDIGYEDNQVVQTFEALEQRFLNDIMKLSKEQSEAEDAENARHRARLNLINAQYEEQLGALRARHTSQREEFLRRESQTRQRQHQQMAIEQQYANSGDPPPLLGYNAAGGNIPTNESHRTYNSDHYDSYREHGRYSGGNSNREHDQFEQKVPYPRGRAYGSGMGGGGGGGGSRYC